MRLRRHEFKKEKKKNSLHARVHTCARHHASHTPDSLRVEQLAHTRANTHTGQLFLTSMTPWWMEVYCFFLSITRVMTITVAMTTPPTIRPMIAPLLEPTSSAKKTCGRWRADGGQVTRPVTWRQQPNQRTLRNAVSLAVLVRVREEWV